MASSPKPVYEVVESPSIQHDPSVAKVTAAGETATPLTIGQRLKKLYFSVWGIVLGAVLGIFLGWGLNEAKPSAELMSWVGIPGELFIRAIKCIVGPLVFTSLIVGMADMLAVGKASKVGLRTGLLYLTTTVVACCEGLIWVCIFRPWFNKDPAETATKATEMAFQCDQPGYFLSHVNNSIACVFDETYNSTGSTFSNASVFQVTDIHKTFAVASTGFVKRSLTEALQGQLFAIVPSNITQAFSEGVLLSIIMFAIPFGIALSLLPREMKVVSFFVQEINAVFMSMISWIIMCTPVAVLSLLSSSIAVQEDMSVLVSDVGMYVLCVLLAEFVHSYVFYPVLLRAFVKGNPYAWIRKMAPAQIFAFGSSSSMASLPIVIECVDATQQVSASLTRFVLSLGATIGMDGGAIYYPIAIVFMAEAGGLGNIIGGTEFFLIVLVSSIGSVGAGPVPSSGIVMTMTIWNSVFPGHKLPSAFAYIVACDWFLDRVYTTVNVTCDAVVTRIVAELVDETTEHSERASLATATHGLAARNSELKEAIESSQARESVV